MIHWHQNIVLIIIIALNSSIIIKAASKVMHLYNNECRYTVFMNVS